jgi:hypothetical protein
MSMTRNGQSVNRFGCFLSFVISCFRNFVELELSTETKECSMRAHHLFAPTLLATVSFGAVAAADAFSTSAVNPAQLPANGSITAGYPAGGNETRYYFTADLKPGVLASQIAYKGAPDSSKTLEFTVANAAGREVGSYYIKSFGENYESARTFRIDNSGAYTIRVAVKGPEAASFKVDLGGTSLANKVSASSATTSGFSTSYIAPSAFPADGVVSGTIPAGRGAMTSYYFTAPLKAGKLMSQIGTTGSGSTSDMIELALLNPDGTTVDSYYTKSFEKHHEATKIFNVDNSANYVIKVTVQGAETTAFRAEFGGSAVAAK